MNNKLKIELMEDGLVDIAKAIILDFYPDYFMGEELDIEDEPRVIETFDTLQTIINNRDNDPYDTANYDMGYYLGVTSKECISDKDKDSIIDYIELLNGVYEDNQYDIEDYEDDDEDEGTMTAEDKYEYDKNQREFEYNRIIKIINNL